MEIGLLLSTVFSMLGLTGYHIAHDNGPLAWTYFGAAIIYAGLLANACNS